MKAGEQQRPIVQRGLLAVAIALLGGALVTWTLALIAASAPPPPLMLVFAPHPAASNAPIPIRVVAFDAEKRKRVEVTGEVVTESGAHPLVHGQAQLKPHSVGPVEVTIRGQAGGRPVTHAVTLLVGEHGNKQALAFSRWTEEVGLTHSPALLPIGKSVSTHFPTRVVVAENPPRVVTLKPSVIGAKAPDGRALRLERKRFAVRLPAFVPHDAATFEVVVESRQKMTLFFDLYRDSQLAAFERVEVNEGKATVALSLPRWPSTKTWTVAAGESPIGRRSAAFASTVVASSMTGASETLAQVVGGLATEGAELALVRSVPKLEPKIGKAILQAAASRLHITPPQPPQVGPSRQGQLNAAKHARAAEVEQWRVPFRGCTLGLAVLALGVAVLPARWSRREQKKQEGLSALEDDLDIGAETRMARVRRQVVAGAALLAAAGVLWVLDWSLGFVAK